jgi:hypothetical protein
MNRGRTGKAWIAGAASACGLCLVLILSCVPLPQIGPPPMVGPPTPPKPAPVVEQNAAALPDTTIRGSEADSAAAELNRIMLLRGRNGPPPEMVTPVPVAQADTSRATRDAAAGGTPATAPPDTEDLAVGSSRPPERTNPEVSVDLPAPDRFKLRNTALADIAVADSLVRTSALRPMPGRERDKLETALGLTRQARDAIERGDLQAAANLAYKARLLAAEVADRSR